MSARGRFPTSVLAALLLCGPALAEKPFLTLASTTSTRDSGLLADLLPRFEARAGIEVCVVAVGTGRALERTAFSSPRAEAEVNAATRPP